LKQGASVKTGSPTQLENCCRQYSNQLLQHLGLCVQKASILGEFAVEKQNFSGEVGREKQSGSECTKT
jgi:hypothetical protein